MERNIIFIKPSHKVIRKVYRKDNVKHFYFNFLKWLSVSLSCWTMIFSPLAMGKEAEHLTKNKLQLILKDLGLSKKTTISEFWKKTKSVIPEKVYKDLEQFTFLNKNILMPEINLDILQSTTGENIPVIQFVQDGKIHTAQLYGESAKWVKFNGIILKQSDFESVENIFKIYENSDIKIKNQADQYRKGKIYSQLNSAFKLRQNDLSRFAGFPRVTPQLWKSLNSEQRANYFIKMQLLWLSAQKVLNTFKNESADLKNSVNSEKNVASEFFLKILLGTEAVAKTQLQRVAGKSNPNTSVQVKGAAVRIKDSSGKTNVVSIPYNAETCVVAGYIGAYGIVNNIKGNNRIGCSIDVALATYKNNPNLDFVQKANDACSKIGPTYVACNPIIYGYPNGAEACINRKSGEYQQATHFSSAGNGETCDGKSRLSSSSDIINFEAKDYSNIQPREKQIAAIEADQQKTDFSLTNSYISGVLMKRDPLMLALLEKGEWNLALDEELVRIQTHFEEEIGRAIKTCEADFANATSKSGLPTTRENNQKQACDQLHRRWLFTEKIIASLRDKACIKPALYIGSYDDISLNKKTIDANGTALCGCPNSQNKRISFGENCGLEKNSPSEESLNIKSPKTSVSSCDKPEGIAGFDYEKCKCEDNKKLSQSQDENIGFACEGRNWVPWVLGGLGLLALIAIYFKNKKQNTIAEPVFAAPNLPVVPIVTEPSCQDGSKAPNGILNQCPKCLDGSFKSLPSANRPDGCLHEGGSGNSCPSGGCSGGLPGTGQ